MDIFIYLTTFNVVFLKCFCYENVTVNVNSTDLYSVEIRTEEPFNVTTMPLPGNVSLSLTTELPTVNSTNQTNEREQDRPSKSSFSNAALSRVLFFCTFNQ